VQIGQEDSAHRLESTTTTIITTQAQPQGDIHQTYAQVLAHS
jgi:hypothetical protein